jgi:hypothetical protein
VDEQVAGAGWYPDPWFSGQHRYWSGRAWTGEVFADGAATATLRPETERPPVPPPATRSATPPPAPSWAYTGGGAPAAPDLAADSTGFARWEFLDSGPEPVPPAAGRRRLTARQLNVLALVVGLLLGFGVVTKVVADGGHHDDAAAVPPPFAAPTVPTPQASAPASDDPQASALQGIVVRQQDVPPTSRVQLLDGGNQVQGQTTLDLCNGTFPSEALRTARLQVVEYTGGGLSALSTEAVLYRTPAAAEQAMREVQRVASACPSGPVVSPVGEPTVTTVFHAAPDPAWPAVDHVQRLAYSMTTTDQIGITDDHVAVYLRRGRVLEGLYFPDPTQPQPAVEGQTSVAGIVAVFGRRIAALPTSVVGG